MWANWSRDWSSMSLFHCWSHQCRMAQCLQKQARSNREQTGIDSFILLLLGNRNTYQNVQTCQLSLIQSETQAITRPRDLACGPEPQAKSRGLMQAIAPSKIRSEKECENYPNFDQFYICYHWKSLSLCGIGVALSTEAEMGNSAPTSYAEVGTNMWKNLVPSETQTHDLKIRWQMLYQWATAADDYMGIIAITPWQSAKPTSPQP